MEGTFGQIVTVVEKRAAAKTSIYSWVLERGLLPSLPLPLFPSAKWDEDK